MDTRFARLKTDPRFRRLKKQSTTTSRAAVVDDDDDQRFRAVAGAGERSVASIADYARGVILMESSDEEEQDRNEGRAAQDVEEHPHVHDGLASGETETQPTRRLALVNLDWDHVRATHLLKICTSVLSPGPAHGAGHVLRVSVYPSKFGKERMAREDCEGPPVEVFSKKTRTHHTTGRGGEEGGSDSEIDEEAVQSTGSGSDHDSHMLRRYQLERLRYFYAIVECDTPSTAAHVFEELDGAELERSANVFDISYVPDDMTFDDEPRDEATKLPDMPYHPVDFATDALRHSKVKLTWDEEDPERVQFTRRALSKKEIDEADLRAYIASSPSVSGSEQAASGSECEPERGRVRKERMRALLLSGTGDDLPEGWGSGRDKSRRRASHGDMDGDGDGWAGLSADEDKNDKPSDVDMEITFAPGLSSAADTANETTLERYERKAREKRRARRAEQAKIRVEAAATGKATEMGPENSHSDATKRSKKGRNKTKRKLADHEADVDSGASGSEGEGTGFVVDVHDARFASLHEDHSFAIDPSHPRFKKTKGMVALLDERSKRHAARHGGGSGGRVRGAGGLSRSLA